MNADSASWSTEQWMDWYDKELTMDSRWNRATRDSRGIDLDKLGDLDDNTRASLEEVSTAIREDVTALDLRVIVGAQPSSHRDAFRNLSPEFKKKLFDWLRDYPAPTPETRVESIVDELGPIVIGVEGGEVAGEDTETVSAEGEPGLGDVPLTPGEEDMLAMDLGDILEPSEEPDHWDNELPEDESIVPELGVWIDGAPAVDPNELEDTPEEASETPAGTGLYGEERVVDSGQGVESGADAVAVGGGGSEPSDGGSSRFWNMPLVIGFAILAGAALLGWLFFGGGDEDPATRIAADITVGAADTATTVPDTSPSTQPGESESNACGVPVDHEMGLSSPTAFNDQLGTDWLRAELRDRGWSVPAFAIDNPPEGATELAIVASELNDRESNEWVTDPEADPRQFHSFYIMLLTGIPPSTTAIGSFVGADAPNGIDVQADLILGQTGNAFVSRDSDGYMLVTVIALCEPPPNYFDPANNIWMEGRVVDASLLLYVGSGTP